MSFGVTTAGFVPKRLTDILTELQQDARDTFGTGINLDAESPLGMEIGVLSERFLDLWELAESVYYAAYPDTANGVALDNSVAYIGIQRQGQTRSTVAAVLSGDAGTVIPAGSVVSVDGNSTARFTTDLEYTIGGGGTVAAALSGENPGPVQAPAGTLTVIETPVSGWDSVTNALDAEVGDATESDASLRTRFGLSKQKAGAGTLEAIRADLLQLDDVDAVLIFENVLSTTDGDGRPPKSFEVVILGGDDDEIAQTIWEDKPAGIETFGSETVQITDSQGFTHDINYSRPTPLPIYWELDIDSNADYPADGDDLVVQQVLAYGATLSVGDDVIVYPKLMAYLAEVPGIIDVTVRVGTALNPTLDNNVAVAANEVADFDSSRIEVVSA